MVMPKKPRIEIKCVNCKKLFKVIITSKNRKYCSISCRNKHQFIGKNNPKYGTHPIPWNKGLKGVNGNCGVPKGTIPIHKGRRKYKFNCINCGKYNKSSSNRKFCNFDCYTQYNKGENHWNFGNWTRDYDKKFNKKLKTKIRKRDNYNCQLCGKHQNLLIKKLHVHHIDYDKYNSCEENLISLCNNCHMRTNYKRDIWENYFKRKIKLIYEIK